MYTASVLLILSFGLTMLKVISCFSDGSAMADQCKGMNIDHGVPAQNTEAPFSIEPDNVTLINLPTSRITVVLSAKSNFRGFMLDARERDDGDSVGTFSLVDRDNSLLICGDRVVTQPNNLDKMSISVQWIPERAGQFFFRAAFVESELTFWLRKPIILPSQSTTPPPAQTTLTSTTNKPIRTITPSTDSHTTDTSAAPTSSEADNTQMNPTTSTTLFTTSNTDSQTTAFLTGLSATPPTSEANSTQMNQTTSTTTFTTTSNIDSQTTGLSATPPTSEANSAQMNQTTSTTFTTTSNIDSQTTGLSATPPTSEANSTQMNQTTSTTTFTTTSNIDSQTTVTPTSPPQCVQYVRCVLALLLFSRLCFLGGSSLLIIRPISKKTVTMSASVLELASKTIAAILVLIKATKYECMHKCAGLQNVLTALTVTAMVSSLLHTITVFLHCGPSHELRKCWVCAIIIVDLMNTIITSTAIFIGMRCYEEHWLPILMAVYVVLEIMLYLGTICFEKMGKYQTTVKRNQNHIREKRISPWLFMFLIFTVFTVMLTLALMAGVSLVRMIH